MARKYRNYNPKERPFPIDAQILNMKTFFPSFECHRSRNKAYWIGCLQPTTLSLSYKIKIEYKIGYYPRVFVLSPSLELRNGETKIPHTYAINEPCVYWPESNEWSARKIIAETIVPWTSLWLFYYEIWHVIGKWFGRGVHPKA